MGYKIVYDLAGNAKEISGWKKPRKYLVNVLLVLGAIFLVFWIWGGDLAATVMALDAMAESLGQGSCLQEAFSEFCLDILIGAECG